MAEAVEQASVFLMCVSEKYYLSPNCRLEAEYAIKLQKPIIPLIMQEDYMPLGWLGIIIGTLNKFLLKINHILISKKSLSQTGDKIYYKFSSHMEQLFQNSFAAMLREVCRYYSINCVKNKNQRRSNKNIQKSKLLLFNLFLIFIKL